MLTAIGDVMRQLYSRGWITTRDGNISLRKKNSNYLYITPSGWRKTIIHPEHMVKLKFSSDNSKLESLDKNIKPSGELHMHFLLQKDAKECRAIVHAHPTHVVAAMYAGWNLNELGEKFPELGRYTSVAPNVPDLPAISKILGDVTYEHLAGMGYKTPPNGLLYDIVGQDRHGVCAIAKDPWSAYEHIERLDHICEIVLKSGVLPKKEIK